jgi:hypothetical protein
MTASDRVDFGHTACYRDNVHENSMAGPQWCRRAGPASASGRVYAASCCTAPWPIQSGSSAMARSRNAYRPLDRWRRTYRSSADAIPVCPKSSPFHNSGSRVSSASA